MNSGPKAIFYIMLFLTWTLCARSQNNPSQDYAFDIIDNGPFTTFRYTLENGLELYLVPRDDEPTIETRIMVKAGSNQESDNARGLAHYLEHLLFNGTDKIGAFEYEKERVILQEIEDLFEVHRTTINETEKRNIYSKIDSLSYEASTYARLNEYTDLMVEMGIGYLNAFTNSIATGYMNEIPANQLEKWITLEAERFRNPVFRGFHTELEAVFEEMNASTENGYRRAIHKLREITFSSDQYKAPIGTVEGVKNPSLLQTKAFFDTYYVPNNMAILMAGDFDPVEATRLIDEKFSWMQPKPLPKKKELPSPILRATIEDSITTPEKASLAMYFVHEAANTEEAILAEFVEMLVLNGYLGIVDIGQSNAKSNWLNTSYQPYYDGFSVHFFEGEPIDGVSVKELKKTILNDLERLKTGDFPDWLLKAVANDLNKRFSSSNGSNGGIVGSMQAAYMYDIPLADYFSKQEAFHAITKADVMSFAKKYYNHHAVVYKKQEENNFQKIPKPAISALNTAKNNINSEFGKMIKSIPTEKIQPKLVDFNKDIHKSSLKNGAMTYFVRNTENDLFNLRIVFPKNDHDQVLKIANEYVKLAGTDRYTPNELKSSLYQLGADYNIVTNEYGTSVYLNGLTKNLEASTQLLKHVLLNLQEDDTLLASIKKTELAKLENQKTNKYVLFQRALDYIQYGPDSHLQQVTTAKDLQAISAKDIIQALSTLFDYQHDIYMYGASPQEEITSVFQETLEQKSSLKNPESAPHRIRKSHDSTNVYVVDLPGKQLEIAFTTTLNTFNRRLHPLYVLFNQYQSDKINEEIRETRGLAYSAASTFQYPNYAGEKYVHYTQVGTQTDKYAEVLPINYDLIHNVSFDESVFLKIKNRWESLWTAQRIVKNAILYHYERSVNRGTDYDYRKHYFEEVSNITIEDFQTFYQEKIAGSKYHLLMIGDMDQLDRKELDKYGRIVELSEEDLFGN